MSAPPRHRKCRNRAPHAAHQWRGLNTRHAGYACPGVAGVSDLMAALQEALARDRAAVGRSPTGAAQ